MTPKKNKGKFLAKFKKIEVFFKSFEFFTVEWIMFLIGCFVIFYVQPKIASIVIGIVIILTGFLVGRFNYEKIEEKLEIIGKVNSGVIVIASALIAYINNTKKGEDIFEPFIDAFFTIILLFPFISAFIFFQIYMEKKKKENGFLLYKIAFLLLYSSIIVVFLFFSLIIYKNIKPIL